MGAHTISRDLAPRFAWPRQLTSTGHKTGEFLIKKRIPVWSDPWLNIDIYCFF